MNNEEKILAMLEKMQGEMSGVKAELSDVKAEMSDIKANMATKQEMKNGFDKLENLINMAAKDAARTEKRLTEHIEQPVHGMP